MDKREQTKEKHTKPFSSFEDDTTEAKQKNHVNSLSEFRTEDIFQKLDFAVSYDFLPSHQMLVNNNTSSRWNGDLKKYNG